MRIAVAVVAVVLLASADASGQVRLEPYGITLHVPRVWETIPDSIIEALEAAATKITGTDIEYVAGFRTDAQGRWPDLPYVLIQVIQTGPISEEQYLEAVIGPGYADQRRAANEVLSATTLEEPFWDPLTRLVWSRFRANRPDGTPFQGVSVQRLYGGGVLLLHYYLPVDDPPALAVEAAERVILAADIDSALETTRSTLPQSAGQFVEVRLPQGVSLDLPRNWIALSNNQRITLLTSVRSGLDLSDIDYGPSQLPFAANLYDDNSRTLALMNVRYYPELDLTQADARGATEDDIQELDATLEEQLRRGMESAGMSVTSWAGTNRASVNGLHTFVTEYRRRSITGDGQWRVRLVRVFAGERSFTATVSYSEAHEFVLEPITDRIIASIQLKGSAPSPTQSVPDGGALALILVLSAILTWGIGLAPPIFIRFAVMRRPIRKWPAVALVAALWIFNLILFRAMGSESLTHSALVLVAVVSYAILRKQPRVAKAGSE